MHRPTNAGTIAQGGDLCIYPYRSGSGRRSRRESAGNGVGHGPEAMAASMTETERSSLIAGATKLPEVRSRPDSRSTTCAATVRASTLPTLRSSPEKRTCSVVSASRLATRARSPVSTVTDSPRRTPTTGTASASARRVFVTGTVRVGRPARRSLTAEIVPTVRVGIRTRATTCASRKASGTVESARRRSSSGGTTSTVVLSLRRNPR